MRRPPPRPLHVALVTATLALAACGGGSDEPPTEPPPTGGVAETVTMLPAAFVPPFIEVKVGDVVAWDFTGGIDHNVNFERRTGAPADITPRRTGTVTRQFNTAGTYPYQCTLHAGMIGEVEVSR